MKTDYINSHSFLKIASLITLTSASAFFVACRHTSKPQAEPPSSRTAQLSGISLNELNKGYGIYQKQCYQCHAQPDSEALSVQQWNALVPTMAQHSGISKKEGEAVMKYILATKKQK